MRNKGLFKASLLSLPILVMLVQPVNAKENIHFSSCKEAWENGYSDIHKGEAGYSSRLDRDNDGVACELSKAPRGVFKPRQSNSPAKYTTSGWISKDGYWYYLKSDGSYAKNSWQGSYYLKSDGKMAKSEWVYDGAYQAWYYLKSDGSYAKNSWQGNYYLKSNGKMAKSEWVYDGAYQAWYYLKSDGSYAKNSWQGNYYLKSNGKMAKNEWVDGGRYFVGFDGSWQKQKGDKPTSTPSTTTESTTRSTTTQSTTTEPTTRSSTTQSTTTHTTSTPPTTN